MSATHFHVMGGNPECLPDTNEVYEDYGSAFSAASELAMEFFGDASQSWLECEEPDRYANFKVRRKGSIYATATIEVYGCDDLRCEEEV